MKRSRIWLYSVVAVVLCGPPALLVGLEHRAKSALTFAPYDGMTLISHAGGGLEFGMKSNAKEAFDLSASRGFQYIEADFSQTPSGELVLIHNWDKAWHNWFSGLHYFPDRWTKGHLKLPETADAFLAKDMRHGLTQMSAKDLMEWLEAHPQIRLITDIKDNPVENLTQLRERFPETSQRLIPQIYHPDEYDAVRALGYEDIIFTAYRSKLPDDDIIAFIDQHKIFALTIPVETVTDRVIQEANARDIPVWVHRGKNRSPYTVMNTPEFATRWKARGISGLYTDYLYPAVIAPAKTAD